MADQTAPDTEPVLDESRVDSPTELRNPRTKDIDRLSTVEILGLVNAEDASVAGAVAAALPELARAVDLVVAALQAGRRVHYVGAGTSGRLAAMDAEELGPTYGLEPGRVIAHVAPYEPVAAPAAPAAPALDGAAAGGLAVDGAVPGGVAIEDGEDDGQRGAAIGAAVEPGDVVIGITASGRTPYVVAALEQAAARGAGTVLVGSNPRAPLGRAVDVHVCVDTGPEVITGSTRLKAGTAQKLVLNALSTTALVRLGRTWSNLMIGAVVTNEKLRGRLVHALSAGTGADLDACAGALSAAGGDGRVALLGLLAGAAPDRARAALAAAGGAVRPALAALLQSTPEPPREPAPESPAVPSVVPAVAPLSRSTDG